MYSSPVKFNDEIMNYIDSVKPKMVIFLLGNS